MERRGSNLCMRDSQTSSAFSIAMSKALRHSSYSLIHNSNFILFLFQGDRRFNPTSHKNSYAYHIQRTLCHFIACFSFGQEIAGLWFVMDPDGTTTSVSSPECQQGQASSGTLKGSNSSNRVRQGCLHADGLLEQMRAESKLWKTRSRVPSSSSTEAALIRVATRAEGNNLTRRGRQWVSCQILMTVTTTQREHLDTLVTNLRFGRLAGRGFSSQQWP